VGWICESWIANELLLNLDGSIGSANGLAKIRWLSLNSPRAAKIPSTKSAVEDTSWLLRQIIAEAGRSRFIFSSPHPENDVCVIVSILEFPIIPP
jgi:hypothetical protein